MSRRLPIGIQDFITIREEGFCYVDKTARIHELITGSGRAFFLSRPRRFGKSLLCSTLEALFEGRRELFGEIAGHPALAIDGLEWEWKKHPVIRLDLNAGDYREGVSALYKIIDASLETCANKYGVSLDGDNCVGHFMRLIETLYGAQKERVVVIVDEYAKPLLGAAENTELHDALRGALHGFYVALKSCDAHLQFVFMTGVTKLSSASAFSDLNHLDDLSLDPRYADLCGITQEELEHHFAPEIETVLQNTGKTRETCIEELRRFYNGYRFSKKSLAVYNPFGLLNHFDRGGEFLPHWCETDTPAFLAKLIIDQKIDTTDFSDLWVTYEDFTMYSAKITKAIPLMCQSGYLTIADYYEECNQFRLDYPNEEARASFNRLIESIKACSAS